MCGGTHQCAAPRVEQGAAMCRGTSFPRAGGTPCLRTASKRRLMVQVGQQRGVERRAHRHTLSQAAASPRCTSLCGAHARTHARRRRLNQRERASGRGRTPSGGERHRGCTPSAARVCAAARRTAAGRPRRSARARRHTSPTPLLRAPPSLQHASWRECARARAAARACGRGQHAGRGGTACRHTTAAHVSPALRGRHTKHFHRPAANWRGASCACSPCPAGRGSAVRASVAVAAGRCAERSGVRRHLQRLILGRATRCQQ